MPKINQLNQTTSLSNTDVLAAENANGANTRKIAYASLRTQIQNESRSVFALHGEIASDEQVATAASDWLNTHVTPTGSTVALDDTLLIQGAASDAKATGEMIVINGSSSNSTRVNITTTDTDVQLALMDDLTDFEDTIGGELIVVNSDSTDTTRVNITTSETDIELAEKSEVDDLKNAIENYNSYDVFSKIAWSGLNWSGITVTWDGEKIAVSGTATRDINHNLCANANAFPDNVAAGDALTFRVNKTGTLPQILVYYYVNSTWTAPAIIEDLYQSIIPSNATGMLIRLHITNGETVNGTFTISATKAPTNAELGEITPVVHPHDTIYRTNIINAYLQKYGIVQLGVGTFKINGLAMPDNTILRGCGDSTILLVDNNANGILPGANCTIENLRITCAAGHTGSRGTGSGILVQGNYDNTPYKYNTKISNVTIDGFPCAGIQGKATGYWVANSISAVNCKITNCWTGISLEDFCEFNRFTNCLCYSCYIGANIYSGNNVLVNCSLSNNTVGLYLNGADDNLSGNNGHGAVIGSTINHSNNNTGYAIIARGVTNGFIIDGCNIWYGKVLTDTGGNGSAGILVTNCIFGGGTPEVINWGGNALFLTNCVFKAAPSFTGNQTTLKLNCYMFDGTPVT